MADHFDRTWRSRWASVVLAVLAGVATLLASIGWWVHDTVLDTERFTALVEPVVSSPATADLVSRRVADRVVSGLEVEQRLATGLAGIDDWVSGRLDAADDATRRDLPVDAVPRLAPLAPSLTASIEDRVQEATVDALARPDVADGLETAVSRSHATAVAILREDDTSLPDAVGVDGDVVLDLAPLVDRAVARAAAETGDLLGLDPDTLDPESGRVGDVVTERLGIDPERLRPTIVLVPAARLEPWRAGLVTFDRTVAVLPVLALVLAAAAVWVAPRRRMGVVRVGLAVGLSVVVTLPVLGLVERELLQQVTDPAGRQTIVEVIDVATRDLRLATLVLVAASTACVLVALDVLRHARAALARAKAPRDATSAPG